MSGSESLAVNSSSLDSAVETTRIHSMPCNIDHDGPADVARYFDRIVDDGKELTSTFRGRGLKGSIMRLPVGYNGYVLKEDRRPYSDEQDRILRATHKFSQLTYWNLETSPSENDPMTKAMQWIDIASVLHSNDDVIQTLTPETIR